MSRFLTPLRTELVDEIDDLHELLAPLRYYSALLLCQIIAPTGFLTDFASVPRIVCAYLMFGGKGKRAAVIHDLLYSGQKLLVNGEVRALTREECDAVFKEALLASGYSHFTAWSMYAGVRLGGASHFKGPNVPQAPAVAAQMEAP